MAASGSTDASPPARTPKAKQTTKKAAKKKASVRSRTGASPTGRNGPPSAGPTKSQAQVKTTAKPAPSRPPVKWAGQRTPVTSRTQNTPAPAAAQSIPVVAATEPVVPTKPTGAADIDAPGQEPITIDGVTTTLGDLTSDSGLTIVPFSKKYADSSLTRLALAAAELRARLGTAGNFAILAGSTITNSGVSAINGDVGLDPGTVLSRRLACDEVVGVPPASCQQVRGQYPLLVLGPHRSAVDSRGTGRTNRPLLASGNRPWLGQVDQVGVGTSSSARTNPTAPSG